MPEGLHIGILGVGNLGGALAEGALATGAVQTVTAWDVSQPRLSELSASLGAGFRVGKAPTDVIEADIVVVAVKPYLLNEALGVVAEFLTDRHVVVSVAAGTKISTIESFLPDETKVVRAMPNLAMVAQASATALCCNDLVADAEMALVEEVFQAVGLVVRVNEDQMHVVTALTGSGPAYVSLVVEGLAGGAVKMGLPVDLARAMTCQLLYGTAKLLQESGIHPSVLRDQVTTPGGTTIAGLYELEEHGVRGALMSAVEAASERSAEIARAK